MLTRDSILAAADLPTVPVPVPEWGGEVHVRVLAVAELEELRRATKAKGDKSSAADYAARVICDAQGKRLFTDEDVAALATKSHAAITRVIDAFTKANFIDEDAIDDAEKNS